MKREQTQGPAGSSEWSVFISYSREDEARARAVREVFERLGLRVFIDTDRMVAGQEFARRLMAELDTNGDRRLVVVLASAAGIGSSWVEREWRAALAAGHRIVPVRFDEVGVTDLPEELRAAHHATAGFWRPPADPPATLRRDLVRATGFLLRRRAAEQRRRCVAWARSIVDRLDPPFDVAPEGLPTLLEPGDDFAIVGEGGAGKTVVLARAVLRHAEAVDGPGGAWTPSPVRIEARALSRGFPGVVVGLGLSESVDETEFAEVLQALEDPELPPDERLPPTLLIIDGLDTIPDGEGVAVAADTLAALAGRCSVLTTCRPTVWNERYAARVATPAETIRPLAAQDARRAAPALRSAPDAVLALFRLPLFADLAERLDPTRLASAKTASDVLGVVRDLIVGGGSGARGRAHLLRRLAGMQVRGAQLERVVSAARLDNDAASRAESIRARRELLRAGFLVERETRDGAPGVRLRHDLLDDANAVEWILSDRLTEAERSREFDGLLDRVHLGAGSALLARLLGTLLDRGEGAAVDHLFEGVLHVFDRKPVGTREERRTTLARGWAVTYALRAEAERLAPRILDVLDGARLPSLGPDSPPDAGASSLRPASSCTQETASSLASVFAEFEAGEAPLEDRAVPVLARGLRDFEWRGRFVEALGKYPESAAAIAALVELAEAECADANDPPVLNYLVDALAGTGSPEVADALRRIHRCPHAPRRAARLAAIRHDKVLKASRPRNGEARELLGEQPISEAEYLEGLRTHVDPGRSRWSDWRLIEEYADELRYRLAEGGSTSVAVLEALIAALSHDQSFPRMAVVRALCRHPSDRAFEAILGLSAGPPLPADVEGVVLEELRALATRRSADPADWAPVRLAAAAAALDEAGRRYHARVLRETASAAMGPCERIGEASIVVDATAQRFGARVVMPGGAELDPVSLEVRERWGGDVGPDLETKFRIVAARRNADVVEFRLADSSWGLGAGFLRAVPRLEAEIRRSGDRHGLEGWLRARRAELRAGWSSVPGLAVVHGVVLTANDRLVLARRSTSSGFAPGRWSASFEEQLTGSDFEGAADPITTATKRGLREEFGLDPALLSERSVCCLGVIVEERSGNLAAVTLIRLPEAAELRPGDVGGETGEVEILETRLLAAGAEGFAAAVALDPEDLHPTTPVRLALLDRFGGRADAVEARGMERLVR